MCLTIFFISFGIDNRYSFSFHLDTNHFFPFHQHRIQLKKKKRRERKKTRFSSSKSSCYATMKRHVAQKIVQAVTNIEENYTELWSRCEDTKISEIGDSGRVGDFKADTMIALCLTPALNSEYDTNIDISINDFVEVTLWWESWKIRSVQKEKRKNSVNRLRIFTSVKSYVKLLRTFRETRNRNGTVRVKIVVSFTIELAVVSLPVSNKSERPQTAGISSPYSRWRLAREESSPDEQQVTWVSSRKRHIFSNSLFLFAARFLSFLSFRRQWKKECEREERRSIE